MLKIYLLCFCIIISSCSQKEHITGFSELANGKPILHFKGKRGVFYHYKKNPKGELFNDSEFLIDTISFNLSSNDLEEIQKIFKEEKIYNFSDINTDILIDSVFVSGRTISKYEIYTNKRTIVVEPQNFGGMEEKIFKKTVRFNTFYNRMENILSQKISQEID